VLLVLKFDYIKIICILILNIILNYKMKQYPSRLKFKKNHRISLSNLVLKQQKIFHSLRGLISLKAIENGKLTYKQIEACRKSIRRMLKKQGNIFIRVFTNISLTKKPVAVRMGKGKGSHFVWVAVIRKGQIILELIFNSVEKFSLNIKALNVASKKLPMRTKFIFNYY
jgi:large subunit ribosomal protein L16